MFLRAPSEPAPCRGRASGLQDFLWGFGMHYAILSGDTHSVLQGKDWHCGGKELEPAMSGSIVNRALFNLLGNRGCRAGSYSEAGRSSGMRIASCTVSYYRGRSSACCPGRAAAFTSPAPRRKLRPRQVRVFGVEAQ